MIEVSIKDSTHNDAQYPNLFSLKQTLGLEHATNIERQNTFTSAIITAAFSMTKGNSLSFFYKEMKEETRGYFEFYEKQITISLSLTLYNSQG